MIYKYSDKFNKVRLEHLEGLVGEVFHPGWEDGNELYGMDGMNGNEVNGMRVGLDESRMDLREDHLIQ